MWSSPFKTILLVVIGLSSVLAFAINVGAQGQSQSPADTAKKANARPSTAVEEPREPFDGVPSEKLTGQCAILETEAGTITIEVMPDIAPEASRNFLNLAATGALDTTTFSRVLKGFMIQGGNLFTSERWGAELAKRMSHHLPDEPNLVKHVRGIVSMARNSEPNSATTHFFILVGDGHHLDGKFTAFGRVLRGIDVADAINQAAVDGETPRKPVHIKRGSVIRCNP
ncbi:MAG TPA: peptidylprolyl isomerase [Pyrinomonadaceae bacterium]|jgi:peptidyl-prolyl cis-trans isomerase B (cyclophilin B)|nr:peptidylprolyl isomerase [Pyrinomonadaceae bacterium]